MIITIILKKELCINIHNKQILNIYFSQEARDLYSIMISRNFPLIIIHLTAFNEIEPSFFTK